MAHFLDPLFWNDDMQKPVYRVRNWQAYFEVAQSKQARNPSNLSWVAIRNKHDGKSFKRLMRIKGSERGMALYGAWVLIVQVASKCPIRGVLEDEDGPLDAADLALMTEGSEEVFAEALKVLSSKDVKWLDCDEESTAINQDESQCTTGQDRTDRTGQDRQDTSAPDGATPAPTASDFQDAWNTLGKPFPVIRDFTAKRRAAFNQRLKAPLWRDSWRDALKAMIASPWCRGDNPRGWVADVDWFLRPDTATKLLEGKYKSNKPECEQDKDASDPEVQELLREGRAEIENAQQDEQ